jgi:EAL domain-containing protein (putative c-di-GMP-specific phosphodiesterase class I)
MLAQLAAAARIRGRIDLLMDPKRAPSPADKETIDRADPELTGWQNPLARLGQALEKDEFTLYCQPILALQGSQHYPMGEVLVRLREEETAMLPPGEFLPVFEHYYMMPQLDRWVTKHAVKRLAGGSRLPRLTINVSGQTLDDRDFPKYAAGEVMAAGVSATSVLYEIDEADTLTRLDAAARFATAIKAIGGGLLLDGFGRRSVSFAALKTLRVDYVKIDGSIVRKLLVSEVARTKMNAIVRVAETLRIGVVAECVEDQDVLVRLKALGVGYAQGFGIYQPHPLDSLAAG